MKRNIIIAAIAFMIALPISLSADAYDKDVVVKNMRDNVARIGTIKTAVAEGNFFTAAEAFFAYGAEAAIIQKMDPPKGSKADWDKVWIAFRDKALTGVGACGEQNAEKALKILDELAAIRNTGHQAFR